MTVLVATDVWLRMAPLTIKLYVSSGDRLVAAALTLCTLNCRLLTTELS